ncbi:MAG: enoyl-CoA hydratase [Hahellaceae bacterium]|nr:enoyl-CoA hydratase [Hahellaceae bacterium]MCP5211937.1 enoyl-CoA hydratase [Hahellaceae bacterium]
MTEDVFVSISEKTQIIQINRPSKKNALTHAMYSKMQQSLIEAESNPNIKTTIIYGSTDCFTSGNDLVEFANWDNSDFTASPVGKFLTALATATKPVIAAVNGEAIGIGTTMLLHCDFIYAGTNSRFQMPFVSLGLSPEGASSLLLPTIMGHCRAAELLLLAQIFDSEKALACGLINDVCDPLATLDTALKTAEILNSQPTSAVALTKQLLKKQSTEQTMQTMQTEGNVFSERLKSPEAEEAFNAFFAKRKPDFSQFD